MYSDMISILLYSAFHTPRGNHGSLLGSTTVMGDLWKIEVDFSANTRSLTLDYSGCVWYTGTSFAGLFIITNHV